MNINRVTLCGNLTRAVELKSLTTGQSVCTFSMATNEVYKDKAGNKVEKAEFHNIQVWGKMAEVCAKYLVKGQQVLIEGKITTRSWDDKTTGEKKYLTEIVAENVQFGNRPKGSEQPIVEAPKPDVKTSGYDGPVHIGGEEIEYPACDIDSIPF